MASQVGLASYMPSAVWGGYPPLVPTPQHWRAQRESYGQSYGGRPYAIRKVIGRDGLPGFAGSTGERSQTKRINLAYVADRLALYWTSGFSELDEWPNFSKHTPNYPVWSYELFRRPNPNLADIIMVEFMRTVILNLRLFPYNYDYTTPKILRILDEISQSQYALSNIIEEVYVEAIFNSNFRYLGAKMFGLLHMLDPQPEGLLLALLQRKCEHQDQIVMEYMRTKQQAKARNNAYFLAEVYMQLRGECNRQKVIAKSLCFTLIRLLSRPGVENVRCVCMTLKNVGYDLFSDNYLELLPVLSQLNAICFKYPGKYPSAGDVLYLHNHVWGGSFNEMCDGIDYDADPQYNF